MSTKKVLVSGCNGCMGGLVTRLIAEKDDLEVTAGFDKSENHSFSFPVLTSLPMHRAEHFISVPGGRTIEVPDVIIDFSSPTATEAVLRFASFYGGIPTVIATTGISKQLQWEIEWQSKEFPIFQSANMSYEIAVLKDLAVMATSKLHDCSDIEILERHHNRKKDIPSGTALMLAESINNSIGSTREIVCNRTEKRQPNEIGISSIRGGNIVGVHDISFYTKYGEITLSETCYSRESFAEGAIKAAKWLINQEPNLYTMDDLLK